MRGVVLVIACISALLSCAPSSPPASFSASPGQSALVLQAYPTAAQFGEDGWVLSGGGHDDYYVHRDGDGWEIEPHASTYGKYGTWMRSTDAAPYRGKRVRITIQARTRGAEQRVDVWSRAQAADSPSDGQGLVGEWKKLPADSDWRDYTMVFDVPDSAVALQYGVGIAGPGTMWMRSPKLEVVGNDVAVTVSPDSWPGEKMVGDWTMTGIGAPDYDVTADGDATRIQAHADSRRFVALVRVVPARDFVGKRVHATFDARVQGIDRPACVLKVQRERKLGYAGFLASDLQPLPASSDFASCSLEADVPSDAQWILYGLTYRGAGTGWVRNAKVQ